MRCCVPFCKNTSDDEYLSDKKGITFHSFPGDMRLRAAWLRALGKQDRHLPDPAVVCSQHFLADDIYETKSGLKQIVTGAIPSTVQVCMICLDTDSKMFPMSKHKLEEAYEKLTGHPLCDQGNLKQTVCVQCAQRLINFSQFRDKSLRARALMMELVEKHKLITRQHVKMINCTINQLKSNLVMAILGSDPCDLYILEDLSEDKQTESEATTHRVAVKEEEESDDCMSVDEDVEVANEDDNNADNVNDEFVASNEGYLSDDSIKLESELLDEAPCKAREVYRSDAEQVAETQDPLKYESVPFHCTLCPEEFVHIQNGDSDCGTSQVCKPHTAVSSSSSLSSLLTENRQDIQKLNDDSLPSTDSALTSVARLPAGFATSNEYKVQAEGADTMHKSQQVFDINNSVLDNDSFDTNSKTNNNRLTNCVVKLYDVFKNPKKSETISELCDYKCVKNSNLLKPVRSHSIKKVYTCELCIFKTAQKTHLVSHIKTHTGKKPFSCELCEYKCTRKFHLVSHMRTHSGEIPFPCELCDYKAKHKHNLVRHMKTHTGEKPFSCELCAYKTAHKYDLVSHMTTHTGVKPFSCELCAYKTAQKSHLVRHMRTHSVELFSCKICNYKSSKESNLVSHMRMHTGEKPFSCQLCQFKAAQKINLVNHMRTHTGEKPLSCELCAYKTAYKSHLAGHMRTHTGEKSHTGEKRFSCELCEYKCTRKFNLVSHMRTHSGEIPFPCELCEYKAAHKHNLVRHMKSHTGEKPFSCKLCAYTTAHKYDLVSHMTTHTGEKPFSCELCAYKTARKTDLVTHNMTKHTGEKPFSCELCSHKTVQKSHLVRHMRTHTGEKPFSCQLCQFKAAQKINLVKHMRTHTGEKPFSCELCAYKTAYKSHLVGHMRTHTGEKLQKRFSCELCEYKCTRKFHLVSHMRTHTSEKPQKRFFL